MLMYFLYHAVCLQYGDKAELGMCSFLFHPLFFFFFYSALLNFLKHTGLFSLRKSRTVGRTRCDCFHTQEVITPDLPQFWLRLINIDKQLMRCQAGTRPFSSCLPMTPMERKNDLSLAMSWSFIRAKQKLLYMFSCTELLWNVPLDYSH